MLPKSCLLQDGRSDSTTPMTLSEPNIGAGIASGIV